MCWVSQACLRNTNNKMASEAGSEQAASELEPRRQTLTMDELAAAFQQSLSLSTRETRETEEKKRDLDRPPVFASEKHRDADRPSPVVVSPSPSPSPPRKRPRIDALGALRKQIAPLLLPGKELYRHQLESLQWCLDRENQERCGIRGGMLSLVMGTGKTLIAVALTALTAGKATTATLYVCNKSLLSVVYHEVTKFFGGRLKVLLYHRDLLGENFFGFTDQTPTKNHMIVVTYDTILTLAQCGNMLPKSKGRARKDRQRLGEVARIFFRVPWYRIVADESQKFSNHKSNIHNAMMLFPRGRRLCLTGTPIRNYQEDLFAQLRFCGLTTIQTMREWSIQAFRFHGLNEAILHISMEDADLDLPPKHQEVVEYLLNQWEGQLYQLFFATTQRTMQAFQDKEVPGMTFTTVLEQFTRLRQICIAPHLMTPQSKRTTLNKADKQRLQPGSILGETYLEAETLLRNPMSAFGIGSTKIRGLVQICQERIPEEDKVLIFSEWAGAAHLASVALQQHFPDAVMFLDAQVKRRDEAFVRFRTDPTIRFLCMTMIGSLGLTLIEANHVILLEPHWNETKNLQASARVWRIGQTKECTIWNLIVKGSIEEKMLEICQTKHDIKEIFQGISIDTLREVLGLKV